MQDTSSSRKIGAASIGQFGEIYDFAVFGFSVPILAAHFFPTSDPQAAVLSTFAVYAVAFFARPLGGLTLSFLADRIGRVKILPSPSGLWPERPRSSAPCPLTVALVSPHPPACLLPLVAGLCNGG